MVCLLHNENQRPTFFLSLFNISAATAPSTLWWYLGCTMISVELLLGCLGVYASRQSFFQAHNLRPAVFTKLLSLKTITQRERKSSNQRQVQLLLRG
jgi:hypothetical protein